jgi:hypothetical protein
MINKRTQQVDTEVLLPWARDKQDRLKLESGHGILLLRFYSSMKDFESKLD